MILATPTTQMFLMQVKIGQVDANIPLEQYAIPVHVRIPATTEGKKSGRPYGAPRA